MFLSSFFPLIEFKFEFGGGAIELLAECLGEMGGTVKADFKCYLGYAQFFFHYHLCSTFKPELT